MREMTESGTQGHASNSRAFQIFRMLALVYGGILEGGITAEYLISEFAASCTERSERLSSMGQPSISQRTLPPTFVVVLRYGLAFGLVVIALAISVIPHFRNSPPRFVSHFVLIAIAITFWCAGTGPGLFALLLSCLGVSFLATNHFLTPDFPLASFLSFFVIFSLLMSWFAASRQRAQQLLIEARNGLELRVAERTGELVAANKALQSTQAELESRGEYLAKAQRLSRTGSFGWKVSTREALWSDETYRILGYPPETKPTLQLVFDRIHPEDRDQVKEILERGEQNGMDLDFEHRILMLDGSIKYIHTVAHAVRDNSGNFEYIGAATDITDRKRAEQERERLHELEADLARINRVSMMGELAASLAHEIKQPIGAAVINADACLRLLDRDQPDVTEAWEAAVEMARDASRAADIIDRVRALYGKGSSHQEIVDVNEVIGEMVAMLQNEANRYSVTIHPNLADSLPKVTADRVQLQQVLMNLILNGIEAIGDTTGELWIKSELADDNQLLISVTDTGVGLPAERVDQIFDAFFTTKPQGTGLGLAISRSIVESHGGRLWASANSERGATFQFTLPNKMTGHS
jgi:PAS domain S-box-containing protein